MYFNSGQLLGLNSDFKWFKIQDMADEFFHLVPPPPSNYKDIWFPPPQTIKTYLDSMVTLPLNYTHIEIPILFSVKELNLGVNPFGTFLITLFIPFCMHLKGNSVIPDLRLFALAYFI